MEQYRHARDCYEKLLRFARAFGAAPADLWAVVHQAPDAVLGGGVFKFRLARKGEGRSGGARAIVAMKIGELAVLIYGFEKKDQSNISHSDLIGFREAAKTFFELSEREITRLIAQAALIEIKPPKRTAKEQANEND